MAVALRLIDIPGDHEHGFEVGPGYFGDLDQRGNLGTDTAAPAGDVRLVNAQAPRELGVAGIRAQIESSHDANGSLGESDADPRGELLGMNDTLEKNFLSCKSITCVPENLRFSAAVLESCFRRSAGINCIPGYRTFAQVRPLTTVWYTAVPHLLRLPLPALQPCHSCGVALVAAALYGAAQDRVRICTFRHRAGTYGTSVNSERARQLEFARSCQARPTHRQTEAQPCQATTPTPRHRPW